MEINVENMNTSCYDIRRLLADESIKQMQIQEDVKFMKDMQENYVPTYKNEVKIDNTSTYYDVDETKCSWGVSAAPGWSQPDLFGTNVAAQFRGLMVFKVQTFNLIDANNLMDKAKEEHAELVEKLKGNGIESVFLHANNADIEFIRL